MPTVQINHCKKSFELKPEIKSNPRKLDLGHDLYHTLIDLSAHIPPPSGCPTTQNIILRNHSKILRRGFELKPEIKSNPRKLDLGHDLAAKDRAKTKNKKGRHTFLLFDTESSSIGIRDVMLYLFTIGMFLMIQCSISS